MKNNGLLLLMDTLAKKTGGGKVVLDIDRMCAVKGGGNEVDLLRAAARDAVMWKGTLGKDWTPEMEEMLKAQVADAVSRMK